VAVLLSTALLAAVPAHAAGPPHLVGAGAGWSALFGAGGVGGTHGPTLGVAWATRVGQRPVYAGGSAGFSWLSGGTTADDEAHTTGDEVDGTATLQVVPVMATLGVRVPMGADLHLRIEPGVGALLAWSTLESDAGGTASSFDVVPGVRVPLAVDIGLGGGILVVEARCFRSLGDLRGTGGAALGVVGPLQGLAVTVGWRWRVGV